MSGTRGVYPTVPTAKDRIQVLLEPDDYANVVLLARDEQRSHASMGAVLIREAIKARIKSGEFVPPTSDKDEALRVARLRRRAKEQGLGTNELVNAKEDDDEQVSKLLKALSKLID